MIGCKDTILDSDNKPFVPGKRIYTWSIDTLFNEWGEQTTLYDIWGSSPTNIYAVGHDAGFKGTMWHYDGVRWSMVGLVPAYGGKISGAYELWRLFGFDSTNIYAVGERVYQTFSDKPPYFLDSSFIIHFDGKYWTEERLPRRYAGLISIYGMNPQRIYVGENYGMIYQYDGKAWTADSSAKKLLNGDAKAVCGFTSNAEWLLASTVTRDNSGGPDRYNMLNFQDNRWNLLDTFVVGVTTYELIWGLFLKSLSNGTIVSPGGQALHRFSNGSWTKIYQGSETLYRIFEKREGHTFITGYKKTLIHYNGIDWASVKVPYDIDMEFWGVWLTDEEVFIVANDGIRSYVLHGK
jgi:hypothetical protein